MGLNFEHTTLGQRVLFGTGRAGANLAAEVARLGEEGHGHLFSLGGQALGGRHGQHRRCPPLR